MCLGVFVVNLPSVNTGIDRRSFLRGAVATSAALMAARRAFPFDTKRHFAPVKVATGLGSRALFDDEELIPVRGQLEVLLPQPEIDYCYLSSGYLFPRRDGIILGGTWDHDDWSLSPDPEQTTEILEAHLEIMKGLKSV